jgi:hypothetical protein
MIIIITHLNSKAHYATFWEMIMVRYPVSGHSFIQSHAQYAMRQSMITGMHGSNQFWHLNLAGTADKEDYTGQYCIHTMYVS